MCTDERESVSFGPFDTQNTQRKTSDSESISFGPLYTPHTEHKMSNSESSDKKQSIDDGDISCVPITPHIDRHVRSFPKDKDSNVKTEGERVTKRCQDIICVFL